MRDNPIVVTGSSGLIGSELVAYFCERGYPVIGIDNNARMFFFGEEGCTRRNQKRLLENYSNFSHLEMDIKDRVGVMEFVREIRPSALVHAAAQPSHDWAAKAPFLDFETNAVATLNLLEAVREHSKDTVFVYMSTNKVYGDSPNSIKLVELPSRWDFEPVAHRNGISESQSVDQSTHSVFGASKLAADILVQEYGRYFGIPTCCLRGGCLTGPNHAGVELHGFLSYLIKCNVFSRKYFVYGYQGKQVRDNIHSFDVASFIDLFIGDPRVGEVYNIGGGFDNTVSIFEAFDKVEMLSGRKMEFEYVDRARKGDHIVYYSDLRKAKSHYPGWDITWSIDMIFEDIYRNLSLTRA